MKANDEVQYQKRRKIIGSISIILFAAIIILLTFLFVKVFAPYLQSTEEFQAFLERYGWRGRLILFALQCVQVIIALIPGEVIELSAGYAYGAIEGSLICMAGVALSSTLIFLLTKKIGTPLVELFISREKITQLRFINSEKKLKRLIFLLFFIPGTPKDILTYFVGLTDIQLSSFLIISLVARIPSLLSSTICGRLIGKQDYFNALIVYAVTAAISIIGYIIYNIIIQKHRQWKENQTE